MKDDLIADILGRIRAACSPSAVKAIDLAAIEAEIRRDWGGERYYIAKDSNDERAKLERRHRDQRIRQQHHQGEHVQLLARRWNLSQKRIKQIIAAGR